jgi:hypothetical protein
MHASAEQTTMSNFSGGFATVDIMLNGTQTNSSVTIDIPRNVTFVTASLDIEIDAVDDSPGGVWLDIDEDGENEWAFTSPGYGAIGHQNEFYTDSSYANIQYTGSTISSPGFYLPSTSTLKSSQINASFSPDLGGGFFAVGELVDFTSGDVDGDGLPEVVALSNANASTGIGTAITWLDWSVANGHVTNNWVSTCDNATTLSTGDINGDGADDVAAFDFTENIACIHLYNTTSGAFDSNQNISMPSGLIAGLIGDLTDDGMADLISIHALGILSLRPWVNSTGTFASATTQQIDPNGSIGIPANLVSINYGDFFGIGNESVLAVDQEGHWTNWDYWSGMWVGLQPSFDNIKRNEIAIDLDGDGDTDFIGENDQGYAIILNNGSAWNSTTFQSQINLLNATICDYNGDGNLSLMAPTTGVSDGSTSTIEGNISLQDINTTTVGSVGLTTLEPWSLPTRILCIDMDGDNHVEQIVASGEITKGLFVGGWHTTTFDVDGDGTPEATQEGYAGDGSFGLDAMPLIDYYDVIRDGIGPLLLTLPVISDDYGIDMANLSIELDSTGFGNFNISGLDIGYDASFQVHYNPHAVGNLTNVINMRMTGGVGTFPMNLSFNSTDSGIITITNLNAIHTPGAPDLALPTTPTLVLKDLTPSEVTLAWDDMISFGTDLVRFELFRYNATIEALDLNSPYAISMANITVDEEVSVGATYTYAVRSIHIFGITSNLSNLLEVTIPYPASPGAVTGVTVTDVADDEGGSLIVTWDLLPESSLPYPYGLDSYDVYYSTSEFNSTDDATQIGWGNWYWNLMTFTGLIDGTGYWFAVVGEDSFGNYTKEVVSVGPTYPRNDVPLPIVIDIETSPIIGIGHPLDIDLTAWAGGIENTPAGSVTITLSNSTDSWLLAEDWSGVHSSDLSLLGPWAADLRGEVTIWANYSGDVGTEQMRPIASASTSVNRIVTVDATFSAAEPYYILDWDGESDVRVYLEAVIASQDYYLEGTTVEWTVQNMTSNNSTSGTDLIENGFSQFLVNFPEGGNLWVNLTGPNWILANTNSVLITLHPYGVVIEDNSTTNDTGNNTTNNTDDPWTPSSISDMVISCPTLVIDQNATDGTFTCQITNPNNFTVDVELSQTGWSSWASSDIGFYPSSATFQLAENESKDIEVVVEILSDLETEGITSDWMNIDGTASVTQHFLYSTIDHRQQWALLDENTIFDEPDPNENNTGNTVAGESSNIVLYVAIGAILLIGVAIVVLLRVRGERIEEDWKEDDLEMDMEPEFRAGRISKPLPVGMALDEFEDSEYETHDAPERPDHDLFNEASGTEAQESDDVEEYEEDSSITVDENGTEWYEDEIGVWWFRDPGQEDWEEFIE